MGAVFTVFFVVVIPVTLIAFCYGLYRVIRKIIGADSKSTTKNDQVHLMKQQSTVISKRTLGTIYYVTFDMQNGKRIEMVVGKQDSDSLNDNDRCELTIENGQCTNIERI